MSTPEERFMVLWQIIDYMREGPYELILPDNMGEPEARLHTTLQMSQFMYKEGAFELRSLYIPSAAIRPGTTVPAIRHLVWNRLADQERCREGVVTWPDITVSYYQVLVDEIDALDTLISGLDAALRTYPFDVVGIGLTQWDEETDNEIREVMIPARPPYRRWLQRHLTATSIQLHFLEGTAPEFDMYWSNLWDALGGMCRDKQRIEGVEEAYLVPPQQYAALLTSVLS